MVGGIGIRTFRAMESYSYEPITNNEQNNKEGKMHHYKMNKAARDNDVEMAFQISESRHATVFANGKRRLVSLDVFRGLTVAVSNIVPL